ncbi:MAG: ATP-binding protein [Chloroflexi bacterium]|nr:ATP-binding protein [Chloroflexota bacterium]
MTFSVDPAEPKRDDRDAADGNGRRRDDGLVGDVRKPLGMVVAGSLTEGMEVRLDAATSIENIKVGTFVNIQGRDMQFFGVLTDVSLNSTDPSLRLTPPDVSNKFIFDVVSGTTAYGTITVEPMLTLSNDPLEAMDGPKPSKTIPPHFSLVSTASEDDIQKIFGTEDDGHFYIGNPLDMDAKLCLNIEEFVKRSNGVFGKSGTGKTFLTRLLLIGILQSGAASNLVFDMHGEYGWKGTSEGTGGGSREVKGLKQLFSSKVAVFSLDDESSRRRGLTPDYVVRIGYDEIEPEDIQVLRESLNLSEVAADAAYSLDRKWGKAWLSNFLAYPGGEEFGELARELNVNDRALSTLKNRLSRLQRFDFIDEAGGHNSVNQILQYLNRGMHVILEFGRYGNHLEAYMLVANLITRRIYARYVELKERAMGDPSQEPRPLVITIEEAHKFLSPSIANQTIFGSIAREMRKYNVTLLIVDQRPSGIDEEVMSQLGTKIACLLDNDRDTDAVLTGVSGSRKLRAVLARLESKQQALVFGHALPMPVVIKTREYGSAESYRELGFKDEAELTAQVEQDIEDLFGPGG